VGATAHVWLARDLASRAPVALKLFLARSPAADLAHEVSLLSRLRHDGSGRVVNLIASGPTWYAMDFVAGADLRATLRLLWGADARGEPEPGTEVAGEGRAGSLRAIARDPDAPATLADLTSAERLGAGLHIAGELALALEHVHARGIAHGDVAPGNVVVRPDLGVVLVDFGSARPYPSGTASPGGPSRGTPGYVAPERLAGGGPTPAADLYALGCVLYELVTGRRPFAGADPRSLMRKHLSLRVPPPSSCAEGLPGPLDALVLALLEKSPAARPTFAEVHAELRRLQALLHSSRGAPSMPSSHSRARSRRRARNSRVPTVAGEMCRRAATSFWLNPKTALSS
jgi:serine/threonine protein kinase